MTGARRFKRTSRAICSMIGVALVVIAILLTAAIDCAMGERGHE